MKMRCGRACAALASAWPALPPAAALDRRPRSDRADVDQLQHGTVCVFRQRRRRRPLLDAHQLRALGGAIGADLATPSPGL